MNSNVRYLVFNDSGDLVDGGDIHVLHKIKIVDENYDLIRYDYKNVVLTFGFGLDIKGFTNSSLHLTNGNLYVDNLVARTKYHSVCGQNYTFHSVLLDGKHYSAIVYHDCFESIGYHFFYEWYKFFLPSNEPKCCCKTNYRNVLIPYVNKVQKSMCKHFKLEDCYGNCEVMPDLNVNFNFQKENK